MRPLLAVLFLATLGLNASAEHLYIIPAFSNYVTNGTSFWRSELFITNPDSETAHLQVRDLLGETGDHVCDLPEYSLNLPATIEPGETRQICFPFLVGGAATFVSDVPLVLTSEMTAATRQGEALLITRQTIEPGSRWVEPHESAVIHNVRVALPEVRANLLLVNPNDHPLTVQFSTSKVGYSPVVDHPYEPIGGSFVVPARMLSVVALPEAPRFDCGNLVPCGNPAEQTVTVTSDDRFYVAASSIERNLDSAFRSPIITTP